MNNTLLPLILVHIGNELRIARNKRNAKIQTIARSIQVSEAMISRIENGRYKSLRLDTLIKLVELYGLNLKDIV